MTNKSLVNLRRVYTLARQAGATKAELATFTKLVIAAKGGK